MEGSMMNLIVQLIAGAARRDRRWHGAERSELGQARRRHHRRHRRRPHRAIAADGAGRRGRCRGRRRCRRHGCRIAGPDIFGSGIGGAVVLALVGAIRNAMMKK